VLAEEDPKSIVSVNQFLANYHKATPYVKPIGVEGKFQIMHRFTHLPVYASLH
jgi:hypothetical protein